MNGREEEEEEEEFAENSNSVNDRGCKPRRQRHSCRSLPLPLKVKAKLSTIMSSTCGDAEGFSPGFVSFDGPAHSECSSPPTLGGTAEALQNRLLIWGLFLRGVSLVLCLSFASISFQIVPLAGKEGVTPLNLFLQALKQDFPSFVKRFIKFPTIFWFTGASDFAMRTSVAVGFFLTLAALLGLGGAYNYLLFAAGWAIYLSLNYAVGLTFPWDAFLLEASFLNIFMPSLNPISPNIAFSIDALAISELPDPLLQFLYRYLLGRLMLGFGKLKFLGTNSKHHCYIKGFLIGQPIPTRLGWLGYHLPVAVCISLFTCQNRSTVYSQLTSWPTIILGSQICTGCYVRRGDDYAILALRWRRLQTECRDFFCRSDGWNTAHWKFRLL